MKKWLVVLVTVLLLIPASWFGGLVAAETATQTVEVRTIMEGTQEATDVYIIRSVNPGPTLMIVGGTHGNETSGFVAADQIKDWPIDQGTLVVLPHANKVADDRLTRGGLDGDLNRQFPPNQTPTTELARAIWSVIEEYKPAAIMDLHESFGIHGIDSGAVGQSLVIHYAKDAREFGLNMLEHMNKNVLPASPIPENQRRDYYFGFLGMSKPMIVYKTGRELNVPAFIVEATRKGTSQSLRVDWQFQFASEFLKWFGVVNPTTALPGVKDYRGMFLKAELISPTSTTEVFGPVPLQVELTVPQDQTVATVSVSLDGTEIYSGTQEPVGEVIDTLALKEGGHQIAVKATTKEGQKASYEGNFFVSNWWRLDDAMEAPVNSGWFGNVDMSKTSSTSDGWVYAVDEPDSFYGDESRKVRAGNSTEYLIWEAPFLDEFRAKIYSRQADVAGQIEAAVSSDGKEWQKVAFIVAETGPNSSGWYELTLEGTELLQFNAQWFKLTFKNGTVAPGDLQLGQMELVGQNK